MSKPIFTLKEIGDQITRNGNHRLSGTNIVFSEDLSAPATVFIENAVNIVSEIIDFNFNFTQQISGDNNIFFDVHEKNFNSTSNAKEGYVNTDSVIYIAEKLDRDNPSGEEYYRGTQDINEIQYGDRIYTVILHELLHSMGMAHPSDYVAYNNTSYSAHADYLQDTERYTIMSYFEAGEDGSGAVFKDPLTDKRIFPQTPMLHDFIALTGGEYGDSEFDGYSFNSSTRSDRTVYGYNTLNGINEVYNFEVNKNPVLTIYDTGGVDTIDLSGDSVEGVQDSVINLNDGEYSSTHGMKYNIAIAFGSIIENAIGTFKNDRIVGNEEDNILVGGDGNDTIHGAEGNDSIHAGLGNDSLSGGGGEDAFIFDLSQSIGQNKIEDFDPSNDRLIFLNSAFSAHSAFTVEQNFSFNEETGLVRYHFGNGDIVEFNLLEGYTAKDVKVTIDHDNTTIVSNTSKNSQNVLQMSEMKLLSAHSIGINYRGGAGTEVVHMGESGAKINLIDGNDSRFVIFFEKAFEEYSIEKTKNTIKIRGSSNTLQELLQFDIGTNVEVHFSDYMLNVIELNAFIDSNLTPLITSTGNDLFLSEKGFVSVQTITPVNSSYQIIVDRNEEVKSFGNEGIDKILVHAGSQADLTSLGNSKDEIFLTGSFDNYNLSRTGSNITLERLVENVIDGGKTTERITVSSGLGANNDRLWFLDGSLDTIDLLRYQVGDISDHTELESWMSVGSTEMLSLASHIWIELREDTGSSSGDNITSNGILNIEGLMEGDRWQFTLDHGETWLLGVGSEIELSEHVIPGVVREFEANSIGVRAIDNSGQLVSQNFLGKSIVFDRYTSGDFDLSFNTALTNYALYNNRSTGGFNVDLDMRNAEEVGPGGFTVSFWMKLLNYNEGTVGDVIFSLINNGDENIFQLNRSREDARLFAGSKLAVRSNDVFNDLVDEWSFVSVNYNAANAKFRGSVIGAEGAVSVFETEHTDNLDLDKISLNLGNNSAKTNGVSALFRDLSIYRTNEDASTLYENSVDFNDDGLVAFFSFSNKNSQHTLSIDDSNTGEIEADFSNSLNAGLLGNVASTSSLGHHIEAGERVFFESTHPFSGSGYVIRTGEVFTLSGLKEGSASVTVKIYDNSNDSLIEEKELSNTQYSEWITTSTNDLSEGIYRVEITQNDLAGNVSKNVLVDYVSVLAAGDVFSMHVISDTNLVENVLHSKESEFVSVGNLGKDYNASNQLNFMLDGETIGSIIGADALVTETDMFLVDIDRGLWFWKRLEGLSDGQHELIVAVDGTTNSLSSTLNIDADLGIVTLDPLDQLIDMSVFENEDKVWTLAGTAQADHTNVRVNFRGKNNGDTVQLSSTAVLGEENADGLKGWSLDIGESYLYALPDGDLTIEVVATNTAGNEVVFTRNDFVLDVINSAPFSNEIYSGLFSLDIGTSENEVLLDLEDLHYDGSAILSDTLFIDNDVSIVQNQLREYSFEMLDGSIAPEWLHLSETGVFSVSSGTQLPEADFSLNLLVKVDDGSEASVTRNIELASSRNPYLRVSSDIGSISNLDVSNVVIQLNFTEAVSRGRGSIMIRNVENSAEKSGFQGETYQHQDIVIDVNSDFLSISEDGYSATIALSVDLDLDNNYDILFPQGVFTSLDGLNVSRQVRAGEIEFSTVTPTGEGAESVSWDGSAYTSKRSWFDGTIGNYTSNNVGLDIDVSNTNAVVVVGKNVSNSNEVLLESQSYSKVIGFSKNDKIYVDSEYANFLGIDYNSVAIGGVEGNNLTNLIFSGEEAQSSISLAFADLANTSNLDESAVFASAFTEDELSEYPTGLNIYSIEGLLDESQLPLMVG